MPESEYPGGGRIPYRGAGTRRSIIAAGEPGAETRGVGVWAARDRPHRVEAEADPAMRTPPGSPGLRGGCRHWLFGWASGRIFAPLPHTAGLRLADSTAPTGMPR